MLTSLPVARRARLGARLRPERRRRGARAALAAAAATVVLGAVGALAGAAPANAEPQATMSRTLPEYAYFAWNEAGTGTFHDFWAYLFPFDVVDDAGATTTIQVYCADRMVGVDLSGAHPYAQSSWEDFTGTGFGTNAAEVLWVIEHGYPTRTGAEVLSAAGVTGTTNQSSDKIALAATQIAIWNLTNPEVAGTRFPSADSIAVAGNAGHATLADSTAILAVVRQLLDSATGDGSQPGPALQVVPPSDGAPVSGRVGPFVVRTSASSASVSSTAGAVVDADGAPVATAGDGDALYVRVDGMTVGDPVPLEATASDVHARAGTLWMPADGGRYQTLITAKDSVGYTARDAAEIALEAAVTPSEPAGPGDDGGDGDGGVVPGDGPGGDVPDAPGDGADVPGGGAEAPGHGPAGPSAAPDSRAGSSAASSTPTLAHTGSELGAGLGAALLLLVAGLLLARGRRRRAG